MTATAKPTKRRPRGEKSAATSPTVRVRRRVTRAPEKIPPAATRPERVQALLDLMFDGRFTWHTTTAAAEAWGVEASTARAAAAEAQRAYIREIQRTGREPYRGRIMAGIEAVARSALERTEEVVDVKGRKHTVRRPDHRTARQALMDLAQLGGLVTHRHEVTVTELTDEEIAAQLRAHGLEVIEVSGELVSPKEEGNAASSGDAAQSQKDPAPKARRRR